MAIFKSGLILIITLCTLSCAGTSEKDQKVYETYNEMVKQSGLSKQKSQLITNYRNIPKHRNLRGKMAPGFLFYLNHPSDEKIKGRYRADFKGILRLPYNVVINVKGLNFKQLKKKVLKAYSKFFQRGVDRVQFKLIYMHYFVEVRGFVEKPGRYLVTGRESLDKVIDKAGGLKGDLQENFYKASIKQQSRSFSVSLNQYFQNNYYTGAFVWTGGDTVFVTQQDESEMGGSIPIITVLSGVKEPGKVLYKEQAHLFYYLGKSGGALDNLGYTESYIIRTTDNGMDKIQFDLTDVATIPAIQPNDVIMLQTDKRTYGDKILERTGQIASILASFALIILAL